MKTIKSAYCTVCHLPGRFSYQGTSTKMCYTCFTEWKNEQKCPECEQICLENAVETESDDGALYWWHYDCLNQAYSDAQREEIAQASQKTPQRESSHLTKPVALI